MYSNKITVYVRIAITITKIANITTTTLTNNITTIQIITTTLYIAITCKRMEIWLYKQHKYILYIRIQQGKTEKTKQNHYML